MIPDTQLLRNYAGAKSQDAFTELVRRHLNLVHSAALRQVRSPQLAEEISQSVFIDLARAADKLKPDTILTAWLYQVTRRTAIDVVRRESRRQARERLAVEMADMNTAATWTHIEPLLDDAMEALDETDRAAILLRYFENKSLREVGQSLGTSDDAAQKRVSRAIERLREFFSKRGVFIGASGLVVLISANAVHAAPLALAATISTAAVFAGATIQTSTAVAATKAIAMTTLQKAIIGATLAAAIGTVVYKAHRTSRLREENQTLDQQKNSLAAQIDQMQRERDDAKTQLASLREENMRLKSGQDLAELLKLRAEVQSLRDMTNELQKLRRESETRPQTSDAEKELQAGHDHELAQGWMQAFMDYASSNQGEFPASFDEAKAFFPASIETKADTKPDNFEILYHGSLNEITNQEVILFREKKLREIRGVRGRFDVVVAGPRKGGGSATSIVRYLLVPTGFDDADLTDFEKVRIIPTLGQ